MKFSYFVLYYICNLNKTNMNKKLSRSNDRMLAGVCSGIANYLDVDVSVVRILTVIGCMFSGIVGIALYFLVGILMDR